MATAQATASWLRGPSGHLHVHDCALIFFAMERKLAACVGYSLRLAARIGSDTQVLDSLKTAMFSLAHPTHHGSGTTRRKVLCLEELVSNKADMSVDNSAQTTEVMRSDAECRSMVEMIAGELVTTSAMNALTARLAVLESATTDTKTGLDALQDDFEAAATMTGLDVVCEHPVSASRSSQTTSPPERDMDTTSKDRPAAESDPLEMLRRSHHEKRMAAKLQKRAEREAWRNTAANS